MIRRLPVVELEFTHCLRPGWRGRRQGQGEPCGRRGCRVDGGTDPLAEPLRPHGGDFGLAPTGFLTTQAMPSAQLDF